MKRITEPELMNQAEQVAAYAAADFEQAHQSVLNAFEQHFLGYELSGEVLDLGCGCGDISFRFGRRFPDCRVIGIDGSATMLAYAERIKAKSSDIQARIQFIEAIMPTNRIPVRNYTAIISNSFLHHLHSPEVLWRVINQHATAGTKILIVDLYRPESMTEAKQLVEQYAANEAEILQRDFYLSLLAAFSLQEIQQQLAVAQLTELEVKKISDRHVLIVGEKKA